MDKEKINIYCQIVVFFLGFTAALYCFENKYEDFDLIGLMSFFQLIYVWKFYDRYKKNLPVNVAQYFTKLNYGNASCLSVLLLVFVFFSLAILITNLILLLENWMQICALIAIGIGAIYVTFLQNR